MREVIKFNKSQIISILENLRSINGRDLVKNKLKTYKEWHSLQSKTLR